MEAPGHMPSVPSPKSGTEYMEATPIVMSGRALCHSERA